MVLTLYLYDGDGREIAWVTADPYEYWVSDTLVTDTVLEDDYNYSNELRDKFTELEVPTVWDSFSRETEEGHEIVETLTALDDLDPEDHLNKIENRVERIYCDSTEIVDE